jgi:ribosomal protein L13E
MWLRREWKMFYRAVKRAAGMAKPPRPLSRSLANRLAPAEGFSLDELVAAGVSLLQAESWGIPVDLGRMDSYEPNVSALRMYARAARVAP